MGERKWSAVCYDCKSPLGGALLIIGRTKKIYVCESCASESKILNHGTYCDIPQVMQGNLNLQLSLRDRVIMALCFAKNNYKSVRYIAHKAWDYPFRKQGKIDYPSIVVILEGLSRVGIVRKIDDELDQFYCINGFASKG